MQNHVHRQQADPDGAGERTHPPETLWPGGPGAAAGGVPEPAAEGPGGRLPPLGLRLRHGNADGGRRLPVGGRGGGPGAGAVPLLPGRLGRGTEARSVCVAGGVGTDRQGERPAHPHQVPDTAPKPGDDTGEEPQPKAEEETDQHHRFLPGETQSSSHATEIGAVKTGGPPTVPKIPQQYYCLSQELSPTDLYTFTRRT